MTAPGVGPDPSGPDVPTVDAARAMLAPDATLPDATPSVDAVPEAPVPEAAVPEAAVPEAVFPDATPHGGWEGARALAPAVRRPWSLGLLAQALVPSPPAGAATWVFFRPGDWRWTLGAALLPWVIAGGFAVRLPGRRYAAWRYELTPDALRLGRGVMFRSESVVPYTRVQHVDTEQGPLERLLGLARVTVHTASGTSSSLTIPGLLPEDAEALRERLAVLAGMVEPL